MGQTFSSNGRECFGFGSEIKKDTTTDTGEGEGEGHAEGVVVVQKVEVTKSAESAHPPGHPQYQPKQFRPSPNQPAHVPAPVDEPLDSFRPFISPRYHLHLHLSGNDAVPYGAQGAELEPCVRMRRPVPTMVETDVCMCKSCWDEGTEDMRHVIRHRNNLHKRCPKDYPESELKYLPDNSRDVIAHWKAEWRHAHADHELCRPHYLFGCTAVEELQLQQLQSHQRGDHSSCPPAFPEFMLKPTEQEDLGEGEQQQDDELSPETKEIWKASWRHEHGDHQACVATYPNGCTLGAPANNVD